MHVNNYQNNNVFDQQITAKKYLQLFEDIAITITNEYLQHIDLLTLEQSCSPAFPELLKMLKGLNNELYTHALLISDDFKKAKGNKSITLTAGCKRTIKKSIRSILEKINTLADSRNKLAIQLAKSN